MAGAALDFTLGFTHAPSPPPLSFPSTHLVQLRFLCSRSNKVFFASIKSSGQSQIYFCCF